MKRRTPCTWTEAEVVTLKEVLASTTSKNFWEVIASKLPNKRKDQIVTKLKNDKLHINHRLYNPESIKLLEEEISKSPDSLITAFERTAYKIGVSPATISACYYNPKSPIYRGKLNTVFLLVSKKKVTVNAKNTTDGPSDKNRYSLRNAVFKAIKALQIKPKK